MLYIENPKDSITNKPRIYSEEKTVSSINNIGKNWMGKCNRIKLDHYLTQHSEINSKWIKDLNLRPEPIKLLEKNISGKLLNTDFLKLTPKAKAQKAKINKWDYLKLKSLCPVQKIRNEKAIFPVGEDIANPRSDKGLVSKIYKELIQYNRKKKLSF